MSFDFFASPILIEILGVSLEGDDDVSIFHDFHEFDLALNNSLPFGHIFNPEEIFLI